MTTTNNLSLTNKLKGKEDYNDWKFSFRKPYKYKYINLLKDILFVSKLKIKS